MVIYLQQSANDPADTNDIPSTLASLKSRMVYLSDGGLIELRFSSPLNTK